MARNEKGQFVKGTTHSYGFEKGHKPWNKGVKTNIVPKTVFKKGDNSKEIEWEVNESGCWICVSHYKDNFGYIRYCYNGKQHVMHRYIYEKYKGKIPKDIFVLHSCDNPTCINPDHLFLGTHEDNMKDKVSKNRQYRPIGISNNMAKLNEEDAIDIRGKFLHLSNVEVGKIYNITSQHVSGIRSKKYWKHL